jgi:hypothetical protein
MCVFTGNNIHHYFSLSIKKACLVRLDAIGSIPAKGLLVLMKAMVPPEHSSTTKLGEIDTKQCSFRIFHCPEINSTL